MKVFVLKCVLLFSSLVALVSANSDVRKWSLAGGVELTAELVSYSEKRGEVLLLIDDTEERVVPFGDFNNVDKAWLMEWLEFEEITEDLVSKLGGTLEHLVISDQYETDLYVYYPSAYKAEEKTKLPMMILFNAGGKSLRYLQRHIEAADEVGMVLVSCGQFRNTKDDAEKEAAFLERFREVFPRIQEEVVFNTDQVFMGGTSGGAWRSYHYSAWIDYKWAGIYASGGWLGGEKYYDEPYAKGMRVAMVNGNNDKGANGWVERDSAILHKHDCEVAIISFEGGHQAPPKRSQIKAFQWLIDSDNVTER